MAIRMTSTRITREEKKLVTEAEDALGSYRSFYETESRYGEEAQEEGEGSFLSDINLYFRMRGVGDVKVKQLETQSQSDMFSGKAAEGTVYEVIFSNPYITFSNVTEAFYDAVREVAQHHGYNLKTGEKNKRDKAVRFVLAKA